MPHFIFRGFTKDLFGGVPDCDSDTFKYILLDTLHSNKDTTSYAYADAVSAGIEFTTGGGYTAGGVTLTAPTITSTTSGEVNFSSANPQWTSTTLTGIVGGIIYDDTVTSPTADPMVVHHDFGSVSGYSVTSGTINVTFTAAASGGVFRFTV